ncbi:MAG: glycosyltransferase, partial [Acidimicrobiia bacterium]
MTRLDVVVVTYQSADHLADCLSSLPDWCDVVVVDNASSDGSAGIGASAGAAVIRNTTNRGFAAAVNQGVAVGTNDLVLLLNPDAIVSAAALECMMAALDADPSCAVAGPRLRRPNGEPQRPAWPFPTARASWYEALGLLRWFDRRPTGFVIGACLLTRRTVWDKLGEFDERFWLYGEESDYCKRASDAGFTVRLVDHAEVRHIGGASGPALGEVTLEHFLRGTDHFIAKHEGPTALRSHRRALLVGSLLRYPILRLRSPGDARTTYRRRVIGRQRRVLRSHPEVIHIDGSPIVVCSLEPWDEVWRRNQFLVQELLRRDPNRQILWVEPAFDVVHWLRGRGGHRRRRGLRQVAGFPQVLQLQPRKVLPRKLGRYADQSLARQVRRAARRLGMVRPTLWVNDPTYASLVEATRWPALYDMTDDWALATSGAERQRILANEDVLFDRCARVVVCSPGLEQSRAHRRNVTLIPNAVDAAFFEREQPRPADLPDAPTAVYVGTLHQQRIDTALVERLAREQPQLQLVLVGPNVLPQAVSDALGTHPNIHLLGSRPYEQVPAYLQHANVLIVPHAVNEFTESLDPIKAYELLCVDRPVVATPVAGFRELHDTFTIADASMFIDAVSAALQTEPGLAKRNAPSWSERAEAFDTQLALCRAERPLTVVYLGHTARLSGGELALARLLPALGDVERHVILAEDGPLVDRLRKTGAIVEVLPMSERARGVKKDNVAPAGLPLAAVIDTYRYCRLLQMRLEEMRPDLIHTNTLKAALYGAVAGRMARVPVIWHVRDRIADDYLPKPAVAMVRLAAKVLPNALISNSASTMTTLGRVRRIRSVVPSPVVFDSVTEAGPRRDQTREVRRVGLVGRISPWKGQDVFLRAFALAFPDPPVTAVIVGSAMFGEEDYEAELVR